MISLIFYNNITIAIIITGEFTEVKKAVMNGIHTRLYTSARNMVTGVEEKNYSLPIFLIPVHSGFNHIQHVV